jgi:transcriptional regulator with PAS, ATPase and Fis domain
MFGIIGHSPLMRELFQLIKKVSNSSATVLILGESGTGKEVVANAIHNASKRKKSPNIAVNCGAISESLLESLLFGHKRGSFTGAVHDRKGCFEEAQGGTLFLDEVGEMPPALQVKFLRVLQEKSVVPVGSTRPIPLDVRIIAATNKDLQKAVANGEFREDLYYRLDVISLRVPPLRDRKQDIPTLLQYYLKIHADNDGKEVLNIAPKVLEYLLAHDWPGNVRELVNLSQRLTVLCEKEASLSPLPEKILASNQFQEPKGKKINAAAFKIDSEGSVNFKDAVDSFERELILSALSRANWNKNKAAEILQMNRTTLVEKIKRKSLEKPPSDWNGCKVA